MSEPSIERVDEIPIVFHCLMKMGVAERIDRFWPAHGNWKALSYGQLAVLFIMYLIHGLDHRLSGMEGWVDEHQHLLERLTGWTLTPKAATDDRLGILTAEAKAGLLYLVMRLLPGQSLATRIAGGKLAPAEACRVALEVARALATAHAKGVVHRDIKPGNILLDAGGHAFVTDFGISSVTAHPDPAAAGATVGTPYYMSPEQAMGEAVDGRSDVYSLGVVLFEMLTGKVPFEGRNLKELIAKHISAPIPSVADLEPKTPTGLVLLARRMMAKEPGQRPDAAELVKLLEATTTPDALLTPGQVRGRRWRRRGTLIAVAVVSAGLVIWLAIRAIVGMLGLMTESGQPPALVATGIEVPDSLAEMCNSWLILPFRYQSHLTDPVPNYFKGSLGISGGTTRYSGVA